MLKIAVVGAGYWGQNHIRVLSLLSSLKVCQFMAIADIDSSKKLLADQYNVKFFKDFKELVDKVEALVIATPAALLAPIGSFFLKKGKHLLIEKPFAKSLEEAEELIRLSRENKLTLMVGHVFLYTPQILKIKQILKEKTLGKIFYAYCQRLNLGIVRSDVNALWNFAPHDISIFMDLFNNPPIKVSCLGTSFLQQNNEDVVFLQMEFPNKIFTSSHLSWIDPVKTRKVTIVGSKGMLVWDDTSLDQSIRIYKKSISLNNNSKGSGFAEFKATISYGEEIIPFIKAEEPLKNELLHFIDCIESKKTPKTSGTHALEVLKVLILAQKSLNEN